VLLRGFCLRVEVVCTRLLCVYYICIQSHFRLIGVVAGTFIGGSEEAALDSTWA